MERYKIAIICFYTYLLTGCMPSVINNIVGVDIEARLSLDSINNYLQFDSLICISSKDYCISQFDKMIRNDSEIFILDKAQNAVFKIDTSKKNIQRIIYYVGKAKNEYIKIADIAMDKSHNIYVLDRNSRKVNVYNTTGQYIRTVNVVYGSSIAISDKDEIAINCNQAEEDLIYVYSAFGEESYRVTPDAQAPQHTLNEVGIICPYRDGFVYTRPFDFNIYQIDGINNTSLALLNFGNKQFDVNTLNGLDIKGFQNILYKVTDKIMSLSHLSFYNDYLFFSTDKNDQILFNTVQNDVFVLSNMERPYNMLFYSLFSVNKKGQFCSISSNSNIKKGYLPMIEINGAKLPQLNVIKEEVDNDENAFWILMGKVK